MVEFALVLPVLVLLLFGVIEFGSAFWTKQQVSAAASEGARRAAVSRSSATRSSDVTTAVRDASPSLSTSNLTVTTSSSWTPGVPVTVKVTYQTSPIGMGLLETLGFNGIMTAERTARVEQ